MDRGAWQGTVHGNAKELDTTEQLNNTNNVHFSSVQALSPVRLFAIPWTVAHEAPLSMEFSRQEY